MAVQIVPEHGIEEPASRISARSLAFVVMAAYLVTSVYGLGNGLVRAWRDEGLSDLTNELVAIGALVPAWYFARRKWYVPSVVIYITPSLLMLVLSPLSEFTHALIVVDLLIVGLAGAHVLYGAAVDRILPVSVGAAVLLARALMASAQWTALAANHTFSESSLIRLRLAVAAVVWAVVLLFSLYLATVTRESELRRAAGRLHRFWKPTTLFAALILAIGSASVWHRTGTRWSRWETVETSGLEMNGRYTVILAGALVALVVLAHRWHAVERALASVSAVIGMTITLAALTGSDAFAFAPARFITLLGGLVVLVAGLLGAVNSLDSSPQHLRRIVAGLFALWGTGIAVSAHLAWGRPRRLFVVTEVTDLDEVTRLAAPGLGGWSIMLGVLIMVGGASVFTGRGWKVGCAIVLAASTTVLVLATTDFPYRGPLEGYVHRGQVMTILFAVAAGASATTGFRLEPSKWAPPQPEPRPT